MTFRLPLCVYAANRGYSWSNVPEGTDVSVLDRLLALAAETRPPFASEADVSSGLVCDGAFAAAFSLRTVPAWDSEGRPSEYSALAVFPAHHAAEIDLTALLADPFFTTPTHEPPTALDYAGPAATQPPVDAPGRLLSTNRIESLDARCAGKLLATYAARSRRWIFKMNADGQTASAETDPWRFKRA